jgi:hypothetical protein
MLVVQGALNQGTFPDRELGIGLYPFDFGAIAFNGIVVQNVQVLACSDVLQALRRQLQPTSGAVIREPLVKKAKLPLWKYEPLRTGARNGHELACGCRCDLSASRHDANLRRCVRPFLKESVKRKRFPSGFFRNDSAWRDPRASPLFVVGMNW